MSVIVTIKSLTFTTLAIPFKVTFKHSSASRKSTQAVWVEAHSDAGQVGYGEGCPREYVTGEGLASAEIFFQRHRADLMDRVTDVDSLRDWAAENATAVDANPAAWCAIELALLDLFAKDQGVTVEQLLGLKPLLSRFHYSAVLGDGNIENFRATLSRYHQMGFKDFKVKLSGDLEQDKAKAATLAATLSEATRLRLDANNLWNDMAEAASYLESLQLPIFAIEEPLQAFDYEGLKNLSIATGYQIILDESLLIANQVKLLPAPSSTWIANIRVSKMGGLLRSLEVIEAAIATNIDIIVGAQVGETSLLTRAGITVASQVGERLIAQEGAFGTLLLESDICSPALMFGSGGNLDASDFEWLQSNGLGTPIMTA